MTQFEVIKKPENIAPREAARRCYDELARAICSLNDGEALRFPLKGRRPGTVQISVRHAMRCRGVQVSISQISPDELIICKRS